MHEYICFDPYWERYVNDPDPATEEEYWDRYYSDQEAAEQDAMTYAEEMADMYDWDSEEEREDYIREVYEAQLSANEKGR